MFDYLTELEISRTVFHDLPNRKSRLGAALELSDIETELDVTNRNLLRGKLVGGLQRHGYPIVIDTSIESSVAAMVYKSLSEADLDIVTMSRYIAQFLYDKQPLSSVEGVLAVIECQLRSRRALALVKLEQVAGSLPVPRTDGGRRRLDLDYVSRVLLTDKIRVLKAGLFISEGTGIHGISGLVADAQLRDHEHRASADYFLKGFLGCKLQDDSAHITKRCFDAASEWIDTRVDDVHDKFRYRTALRSEMLRDVGAFDLEQFAAEHLDLRHQSDFSKYMEAKDVPVHSLLKDTKRIRHKLQHAQTDLADGVRLITKAGIPNGQISMDVMSDGSTIIIVKPVQET